MLGERGLGDAPRGRCAAAREGTQGSCTGARGEHSGVTWKLGVGGLPILTKANGRMVPSMCATDAMDE